MSQIEAKANGVESTPTILCRKGWVSRFSSHRLEAPLTISCNPQSHDKTLKA